MKTIPKPQTTQARTAALEQLKETTLRAYLNPIPSNETLRHWFDKAGIPRLKSNPHARRGGGRIYYSVAAVEKLLRQMLPGRLVGGSKEESL